MSDKKNGVKILLCGFYFQGNTGDDLLMDSIVETLSRYGEVRVTSTETFDTDLLDWCQLLVIGAGSHITPRGIGGYSHAKYAKENGKKVVFYSLTVEEGQPQLREHLARADLITVRDFESKRVVEANGFRAVLASDPIFKRQRRVIGFSFRKWVNEPPRIVERLSSVLDNLAEDYDVLSIPYTEKDTDTESDTSFHEQIIQRMKNKPDKKPYVEFIERIDLLIGMRLHALINAINIGKKVLAIDYDAKVGRIFSELPMENRVVPYDEVEKIPQIVREKIFKSDALAMREKVNEALIARICADIQGVPNPKISVIMLTYNRETYLKEAIDSILNQSMQDWELVIIDDGSTDNTRQLVESYKEEKIRYYNFGHNGITFSRNIGNLISRGEIIAVADSDDINLPYRLELTYKEMEKCGADILYGSMIQFKETGEKELVPSHPFSYERLQKGNFLYHPTVAYRREVAMTCPYSEDLEMSEDYHMYLQAAKRGYKFCQVEEPLAMYRLHEGQISFVRSDDLAKIHERLVRSKGDAKKAMVDPMVSVIIATYNRPTMLKEALMSVFSQTYQQFEVIVVNDGGEDVSEIINSIDKGGKIVYLQHMENKGISAARNTGLKAAKGDYIAYLDDDDIYYPNHLETLVNFLVSNNCQAAYTDSYYAFQEWVTDRYVTVAKKIIYSLDFSRQRLLISNYLPTINIIHTKDVLEDAGLFDETLDTHEDWDLWIRISEHCDFHHINTVTAEVRVRSDGSTMTSRNRMPFLKTLKTIYSRYSDLVTDSNVFGEQKKVEEFLTREVEIQQMSSSTMEYGRLHHYRFAKEFVKDKKVLVLAGGKGYGSFILSEDAESVTCVDKDERNIRYGSSNYIKENLEFIKSSITDVPVKEEKIFDVIVCFEALEHIEEHNELMKEVKRLLKEDGIFIVSSPNKYISSGHIDDQPHFPLKGLSFDDFKWLLKKNFKNTLIYGQKVYPSSNIFPLFRSSLTTRDYAIEKSDKDFLFVQQERKEARYLIAVSSDAQMKDITGNSYLVDVSETLFKLKDSQIRNLEAAKRERDVHISNLEAAVRDKDSHISNLRTIVIDKDSHISNLEATVRDKDTHVTNLEAAIREKEGILNRIYNSHGWKALLVYYRLRNRILPVNSRRRLFAKIVLNVISNPGGLLRNLNKTNLKKLVYHLKATGPSVLEEKIERRLSQGSQYEQYLQYLESLEDIKGQKVAVFQYRPKISIIVPVYNTDEKWLRLCIESVINQVYDNWELCIAEGGSTILHVKKILNKFAEKDNRIKVKFLPQNKGISGNTNEALSLATGEFVGFLDHDDMLTLNALYEVVEAINKNPSVDFIYSDEIRVDSKGNVINVAFRPDFSEYYYLSHPYIVHLIVFRKRVIDKIGGLNEADFNSNISQDIDLVLRAISNIESGIIIHIPKPLYKWRTVDQSAGHINKGQVHEFTKKAIKIFLDRKGMDAYVEDGMHFNTFRVRFNLREDEKVSIIIPTKDNYTLLKQTIRSIEEKTDYKNYEVLIIANNTKDDKVKRLLKDLSEDKRYKVLEFNEPFNYSAINNFAVSHSEGRYLFFLNDDVEVINPDWLTSMVEIAQDRRVGIVGAKLIYPDGRIQHAGVVLGLMNGIAEHTHKFVYAYLDKRKTIYEPGYEGSLVCIREYSAVTGACMLIKKNVFEEVRGFSEDLKVGFNDIDLCLKVREKGYKILFTPYAMAYHYESASRRNNNDLLYHPEDKNIFIEKWGNIITKGDPYYNPNLSLNSYVPVPKIIKKLE